MAAFGVLIFNGKLTDNHTKFLIIVPVDQKKLASIIDNENEENNGENSDFYGSVLSLKTGTRTVYKKFFEYLNKINNSIKETMTDGNPDTNPDTNPEPTEIRDTFYDVPFTTQSPLGAWGDPRQQDGCEEAVSLMAIKWVWGENLALEEAEKEILSISEYEKSVYGIYRDTGAEDTMNWIIKDYFQYQNVELQRNITVDDVKLELSKGNLVILPVNGRVLENQYFLKPAPLYHMILVVGYNIQNQAFQAHDPGTQYGKNFVYSESNLEKALQDYYSGYHESITNTEQNMIIVKPYDNHE